MPPTPSHQPNSAVSSSELADARPLPARLVRWVLLGAASGMLAGMASAAFLAGLDWATDTRLAHPVLIWFLPLAGLSVALAYHRFGGEAAKGSGLLIDEIHQPRAWVPRRMAPMVAIGAVISHLFGASVGREGTALQMSGSLTDLMARRMSLRARERRALLVASLAAGFGGMFGVPVAGAVFGLEVQAIRPTRAELVRRARRRAESRSRRAARTTSPDAPGHDASHTEAMETVVDDVVDTTHRIDARVGDALHRWRSFAGMVLPVVAASVTANLVVRGLGHHSEALPHLTPALGAGTVAKVAAAGIAFGLTSIVVIAATDSVHHIGERFVAWPPLRPFLGGIGVLGLVVLSGREYLGLSIPLAADALSGQQTSAWIPVLKIAFTALCLGSGFVGGEVTPLFVVGATTGAAIAPALGLDEVTSASLGYVAVFAAAANTPAACAVMAVEVFGWGMALPATVACLIAFASSSHRGIYPTQRVITTTGTKARAELPRRRRPRFRQSGSAGPP